ncbi:MAG TPA: HAMP domain-containing sensor histidine kinase [Solirubrobacteraceae bacterium]|jgi:signal transduction histidine kinase
MSAIAWLRSRPLEVAWVAFAAANLVAMLLTPEWETIPFHFIWVSLTIVYGLRVWGYTSTSVVLGVVAVTTGAVIFMDEFRGADLWGELTEVPLMSAMFIAMVWHAQRRQAALRETERIASERAELLERQERLLRDVSHELRTPVTIARGHLEMLQRGAAGPQPEVGVAIDELDRIGYTVERLLLLAKAKRPDFVAPAPIDLEPYLEDVFVRWSEVAPRIWRLGDVPAGTLFADPQALRIALDALLENAVAHTSEANTIELSAQRVRDRVAISLRNDGPPIPGEALGHIFERFARADPGRSRRDGGVGLGLAIVSAIAHAHGGECTVASAGKGCTFVLRLPGFVGAKASAATA